MIAFYASAFCYGPASIGLAVARELRHDLTAGLRLVALGEGTTLELLSGDPVFDQVYPLQLEELGDSTSPGVKALQEADLVVSVGDFELPERLFEMGRPAIVVDPLYWLWDTDPIRIDHCLEYFALDFPGVKERVDEHRQSAPDDRIPRVVEPVYDLIGTTGLPGAERRNALLINFGGMESPLGDNFRLALAMAQCMVNVALEERDYEAIHVCGGGQPIRRLANELRQGDERLRVGALKQPRFFEELATCRDFVTIPGLSIVFEAVHFRSKTLLALPLNYSQHRQGQVYRRVLTHAHFMFWEDFEGYATLPAGMPEEEGVAQARDLGIRFAEDNAARKRFQQMFREFLAAPEQGVSMTATSQGLSSQQGTRQIVRGLLARLPAAPGARAMTGVESQSDGSTTAA